MAEPDNGDREVTRPSAKRRRARRPAGPPEDVERTRSTPGGKSSPTGKSTPGGKSSPTGKSSPGGKSTTAGKPVKSAPLGRKRKLTPKPEPATEVVAPSVDLNKSDEPDSSKPDSTQADSTQADSTRADSTQPASAQPDSAQPDLTQVGETVSTPPVENTAVVASRVSYRERRSAGRGESDGRPRRTRGSLRRGKSGPGKKRASVRGLGVVIAAVSAIALIAAMVVASTFFVLGTNEIDDRNDLRAEYSAFARQMVTNLTTLNPENIDASIKSFQDDTSGKAMEQVGQSVEQTVNMIKSENVSTRGAVISEAVTASDADSATVIMVFSWEMNQPNVTEQQTVLQVFRWKLEITRINGELKLTNVEWVT